MRPLPSTTKAKMAKRRTCPECSKVRDHIVRGGQCSVCQNKAFEAQRRKEERTCWDCREVFERQLPPTHHRCPDYHLRSVSAVTADEETGSQRHSEQSR
jgi:Zn finger protein HypA/HybF involved in hydrogenase expression